MTGSDKRSPQGLTPQQVRLLKHIVAGCSRRQTAAAMKVSEETVSLWVAEVLEQLKIRS